MARSDSAKVPLISVCQSPPSSDETCLKRCLEVSEICLSERSVKKPGLEAAAGLCLCMMVLYTCSIVFMESYLLVICFFIFEVYFLTKHLSNLFTELPHQIAVTFIHYAISGF